MEYSRSFKMTADHIKLLKRMWVGWQNCEFGAPEIDPKRPYGNSGVYYDIAEILGEKPANPSGDDETEFSEEQTDRYDKLHRETQEALQIVLQSLDEFQLGEFEGEEYGNRWRRAR